MRKSIRLLEALPCGVQGCTNEAQVATIEPDLHLPGWWLLFPMCKDCVKSTAQSYEVRDVVEPVGSGEPEGDEDGDQGTSSEFLYHINPEG